MGREKILEIGPSLQVDRKCWSNYGVTISLLQVCINDLPVIISLASWYLERNLMIFDASSLAIWLRISGIKSTFGLLYYINFNQF